MREGHSGDREGLFRDTEPGSLKNGNENGNAMKNALFFLAGTIFSCLVTSIVWYVAYDGAISKNELIKEQLSKSESENELIKEQLSKSESENELAKEQLVEAISIKEEKQDARKKIEIILATKEKELHQLYPKLKKFQLNREVLIRDEYVESIFVEGGYITISMKNNGDSLVSPDFTIKFLTAAGFHITSSHVAWVFDTIKPRETRVEKIGFMAPDIGEIAYCYVEFDS